MLLESPKSTIIRRLGEAKIYLKLEGDLLKGQAPDL
jgi:hypothetical protein